MPVTTGKIKKITDGSKGNHLKNVITLLTSSGGMAFIEFRGALKRVSDRYKINDDVIIEYDHDGKISKAGLTYNNLVALNIKNV